MVTINPTDQTATATKSDTAGTVTDDIVSSSPATGTQNYVSLSINATTSVSLIVAVGTRTGTGSIWYSTDSGGSWTEVTAARATASGSGGTASFGPANVTVNLGNSINIANIRLRAQAALTGVGVQVGDTVSSAINSWSISYGGRGSIIMG